VVVEGHRWCRRYLFDTSQEPYVDLIEANIRKVGVNPHDIKFIFISRSLTDHNRNNNKPVEAPERDMEMREGSAWQSPNGYPGDGIHERAKGMLETANKVVADEQARAGVSQTK
jgi:hypothetical protein